MTIKKVQMRDGAVVDFDKEKITNTILKTVKNRETAEELSNEVVRNLEQRYAGRVPTLKDVHYVVEKVLAEYQGQWRHPRPHRISSRFPRFSGFRESRLKKRSLKVIGAIAIMIVIGAFVVPAILQRPSVLKPSEVNEQYLGKEIIVEGFFNIVGAPELGYCIHEEKYWLANQPNQILPVRILNSNAWYQFDMFNLAGPYRFTGTLKSRSPAPSDNLYPYILEVTKVEPTGVSGIGKIGLGLFIFIILFIAGFVIFNFFMKITWVLIYFIAVFVAIMFVVYYLMI